ncbi:hypothetical protein FB451DRAFT_1227457 [Mycena latifolia]|nr:hypothetical protein FB451DRAFT_1227457 [Mycena latifolia]
MKRTVLTIVRRLLLNLLFSAIETSLFLFVRAQMYFALALDLLALLLLLFLPIESDPDSHPTAPINSISVPSTP